MACDPTMRAGNESDFAATVENTVQIDLPPMRFVFRRITTLFTDTVFGTGAAPSACHAGGTTHGSKFASVGAPDFLP